MDRTEQLRAPYLEALHSYGQRAPERLHVPGHGGGAGTDPALIAMIGEAPLRLDVPQGIVGVDFGPRPTPLQRAEQLAADAYGAGCSWFLTNGATQGNHAICMTLAPAGTSVVVQRNCHGSVIDGLVLSGGTPIYLSPGYDAERGIATIVTPDSLRALLRERPDVSAAMIVSPTYFGMVADVAGCAEVAHEHGVALIVDCAWGPHFGFHPSLPETPMRLGADVALTSTHKHTGSLTQSAMLHVAPGREDIRARLGRSLRLMRSTSPSSLLLGSLDAARRQLVVRGARVLDDTIRVATRTRDRLAELPGVQVLDRSWDGEPMHAWDPLRIVLDVRATGVEATELNTRLRDIHDVQTELATHTTIVLVVPLAMAPTTSQHAVAALRESIEALAAPAGVRRPLVAPPSPSPPPSTQCSPREAFLARHTALPRDQAIGQLSAEAISAYPPGIPTLLPGEEITREALDQLVALRTAGLRIHGASDPDLDTLVVAEAAVDPSRDLASLRSRM